MKLAPFDITLLKFKVYCDMSNGGWTLISRFSNADSSNWMQYSGSWWYDRTTSYGSVTSTSNNYDMISPSFWLVQGNYIKITRSDDSSHTYLLRTAYQCIGGRTFRSFITRFGNFRNGNVWNSNACRANCYSYFSGRYSSTMGFSQVSCSSNLQSRYYLSFWCDWDGGDGAVMMIGGGGDSCSRADHGIGTTEAGDARFGYGKVECSNGDNDFGDHCSYTTSYSLNLWIV